MPPPPSGLQDPVSDINIRYVEDPVHGTGLFFWSQVETTMADHFSQPPGMDMARVFSHLALCHSMLLPPIGLNPHSWLKWELSLPSLLPSGSGLVGEGDFLLPALPPFKFLHQFFMSDCSIQHSFRGERFCSGPTFF